MEWFRLFNDIIEKMTKDDGIEEFKSFLQFLAVGHKSEWCVCIQVLLYQFKFLFLSVSICYPFVSLSLLYLLSFCHLSLFSPYTLHIASDQVFSNHRELYGLLTDVRHCTCVHVYVHILHMHITHILYVLLYLVCYSMVERCMW